MSTTDHTRRYDIDWLRVIAIALLLIYHISIVFQPWGVFIGFIQNDNPLKEIWIPMSMLNVWRIPILFFVSGMGVCFAMKKRNWKQLFIERTKRILVPFLFGIIFIVPLHVMLWQNYYNQDLNFAIDRGHLWFLGNIFVYVLLFSPVFFYLKKKEKSPIGLRIKKFINHPVFFLLVVGSFVLETLLVDPESFETYAFTYHGFYIGGLAFFYGFLIIYGGKNLWKRFQQLRWMFLLIALVLFAIRYFLFDLIGLNYMKAIESSIWIFAVFGFTSKNLNKPSKTLTYLSESAYPIYIIHMVYLYLGSYLIIPFSISPVLKLILIILFTFIGCFFTYEFLIKRVKFLRPLFGLKNK